MRYLLYSLFLISSLTYSQIEKKVANFHKITVFDQISVELISSNENKVELSGINSDIVEVVNRNGELKIRMPLLRLMNGNQVKAKIFYTNLDAVEANEGSQIFSNAVFKGNVFDIIAKEGARIEIRLDVFKATVKIVSGGIVSIEGSVKNQDISITAGAIYHAKDFISEQTTISINAGGEAVIFATESVESKCRAGGDIMIYGNPKQVNKDIFAGGNIRIIE
jgi:hypothetical protein